MNPFKPTGATSAIVAYIAEHPGCVIREIVAALSQHRNHWPIMQELYRTGRVFRVGEKMDFRYFTNADRAESAKADMHVWLPKIRAERIRYAADAAAVKRWTDGRTKEQIEADRKARRRDRERERSRRRRAEQAAKSPKIATAKPAKTARVLTQEQRDARNAKRMAERHAKRLAIDPTWAAPRKKVPDGQGWRAKAKAVRQSVEIKRRDEQSVSAQAEIDYSRARVTVCPRFPDRWAVTIPPGGGVITQDWRQRLLSEYA